MTINIDLRISYFTEWERRVEFKIVELPNFVG